MRTYTTERPRVTVLALGPEDARKRGIRNWSLKPIQTQQDIHKHRDLAMEVSLQLSGMRVQKAYAPHIAPASAEIVDAAELTDCIRVGVVDVFRKRDFPADGIFLNAPNEAFMMSAAGCPFITATDRNGKHLAVAHAGRDSLIDRGAVVGEPTRKHLSVVQNIVDAFRARAVPAHDIEMCMHFSIPADVFKHDLDHPQYGRYNRQLGEFVDARWPGCTDKKNGSLFLNLEYVFMAQAAQAHICSIQAIEGLDMHPDLAHTHDGESRDRRNLFIVRRDA